MENLKKIVDQFTDQLESTLSEVSEAIVRHRAVETAQQTDIAKYKAMLDASKKLPAYETALPYETELPSSDRRILEASEKFNYRDRAFDFSIANTFPSLDAFDIFIFIKFLPSILKSTPEIIEEASSLKNQLTDADISHIDNFTGYDEYDDDLGKIIQKLSPEHAKISKLLDDYTKYIRSTCPQDCSDKSIVDILRTPSDLPQPNHPYAPEIPPYPAEYRSGGKKTKRRKTINKKTRKRVK